jgi:hypothetical protein
MYWSFLDIFDVNYSLRSFLFHNDKSNRRGKVAIKSFFLQTSVKYDIYCWIDNAEVLLTAVASDELTSQIK